MEAEGAVFLRWWGLRSTSGPAQKNDEMIIRLISCDLGQAMVFRRDGHRIDGIVAEQSRSMEEDIRHLELEDMSLQSSNSRQLHLRS